MWGGLYQNWYKLQGKGVKNEKGQLGMSTMCTHS